MESPQHGPAPVRVIDELERIDRLGPLDAYQGQVLELIRSGLADGVDAVDISGAVADANDALTRRLLGLAEAHLGPPRVPIPVARPGLARPPRTGAVQRPGPRHRLRTACARRGGRSPRLLHRVGWARGAWVGSGRDTAVRRRLHGHELVPPARRVRAALSQLGRGAATPGPAPGRGLPRCPRLSRRAADPRARPHPPGRRIARTVSGADGSCSSDVPAPFRLVQPAAGLRLDHGRQAGWDRGDRAPGPALRAHRRLDRAQHRAATAEPRQPAARSAPPAPSSLIDAYRFLTELRLRHQVEQIGQGLPADNRISARPPDDREQTTPAHHAAARARHAGRHRHALLHELGDMRTAPR